MRYESADPQPDEDGAALVEFAILAPLLIMLLFGIVTAGLAFNHSISLTHSAREASRQAATLPVSNFANLDLWLDAVLAQVIDDADGSLDAGVPGRTICVAYVHPSGTLSTDVTRSVTRDPSGTDVYASSPCFTDGSRVTLLVTSVESVPLGCTYATHIVRPGTPASSDPSASSMTWARTASSQRSRFAKLLTGRVAAWRDASRAEC